MLNQPNFAELIKEYTPEGFIAFKPRVIDRIMQLTEAWERWLGSFGH